MITEFGRVSEETKAGTFGNDVDGLVIPEGDLCRYFKNEVEPSTGPDFLDACP